MRFNLFLALVLSFALATGSAAQSNNRQRYPKTKPNDPPPAEKQKPSAPPTAKQPAAKQPAAKPNEPVDDVPKDAETIKFDTDLVTVPVIVSDHNDIYVPDLVQAEFIIYEDGIKQEIAFFATVKEPFNVVLMLDTSGSTKEKLGQIQRAAKEFVSQLQPKDRIKIVSFDDAYNDLSEFTNDRAALREAIDRTKPGKGTKLYDAVQYALNALARVPGRRAIVLFTDGVDSYSDNTHADQNVAQLEESGVIVYPIRYNTRVETEAMLREQQARGTMDDRYPNPTGGNRPPTGTTPPTTPGGDNPVPSRPPGSKDPYGLPIPPINLPYPRNRYPDGRNRYPDDRGRYPDDRGRYPDERNRYPDSRYPDSRNPNDRLPDAGSPYPPSSRRRNPDDALSVMLDGMYRTAALYLNDLASASGGKVYFAEDLQRLPDAFAQIANELRNQYSLGYYPTNQVRDGRYRKLQVKVSRKNVVVRARPGYRAPKA